jgi:hypothetical protein
MRTGPERVMLSGKMTEKEMTNAILVLTGNIIALGAILVYFGGIRSCLLGFFP